MERALRLRTPRDSIEKYPMSNDKTALAYPKLKLTLFALLTADAVVYAIIDSWTSAIDAAAWLVLLIMFELESLNNLSQFASIPLHAVRNTMIAIIALVFIRYFHDNDWTDVINSLLWFALIALLEFEVRWPETVQRYHWSFWLATIAVFLGLIIMIGIWLWQSAWLDGYDAALWVAAFGMIEVDIFHFFRLTRHGASPRGD